MACDHKQLPNAMHETYNAHITSSAKLSGTKRAPMSSRRKREIGSNTIKGTPLQSTTIQQPTSSTRLPNDCPRTRKTNRLDASNGNNTAEINRTGNRVESLKALTI